MFYKSKFPLSNIFVFSAFVFIINNFFFFFSGIASYLSLLFLLYILYLFEFKYFLFYEDKIIMFFPLRINNRLLPRRKSIPYDQIDSVIFLYMSGRDEPKIRILLKNVKMNFWKKNHYSFTLKDYDLVYSLLKRVEEKGVKISIVTNRPKVAKYFKENYGL